MASVLDLLSGLLCSMAETCVIFRGSFWIPFFDAFVDACVIFRGFILDPLFWPHIQSHNFLREVLTSFLGTVLRFEQIHWKLIQTTHFLTQISHTCYFRLQLMKTTSHHSSSPITSRPWLKLIRIGGTGRKASTICSLVCFLIYSVNSRSGHDWSPTFGSISHVSGSNLTFWCNFIMVLHGFASRSSKNNVLFPSKNLKIIPSSLSTQ